VLADRGGRREGMLFAMLLLSALGFATAAASTANPGLAVAGFVAGVFGYLASFPVFWGSMTPRLAPAAAAAAIALVNSIGNIGGAVGPAVIGPIKQTQGLVPSVAALAAMMALAAVFALALRRRD
jgi:MFS transporter, ACS family, tartrate transporter